MKTFSASAVAALLMNAWLWCAVAVSPPDRTPYLRPMMSMGVSNAAMEEFAQEENSANLMENGLHARINHVVGGAL